MAASSVYYVLLKNMAMTHTSPEQNITDALLLANRMPFPYLQSFFHGKSFKNKILKKEYYNRNMVSPTHNVPFFAQILCKVTLTFTR